jgi:hypothetical protein
MSTNHSSKEQAHHDAKQQDARTVLRRGGQHEVVVWKPPAEIDDETALTKIERIKTFIHPGPLTLEYGQTVRVKILDVGDSHAEALALAHVD